MRPRPSVRHGRTPEEIDALTRVSAAAADAYRLEDVLEQAAEAALEVTGAASLAVSRWDRDADEMRTLINVGKLGPGEERFPTDEVYALAEYPQVAELLRRGTPYRTAIDDPGGHPLALALLRETGKDSELAVPVVLDGDVWGEVWATTERGSPRFDESDVRFLQAIADRLALVLARAERYTRVSRLAYEDPLTGLANRRAIEERLEVRLGRPGARLRPLTLLLCDLDGLKDINDLHGHYAGDRALCRVAEALEAAAAPASAALVGRLAGDEFCVLLKGEEPSAATDVASATLQRLAASDDLPLSVSLGAAVARPGMAPADLLRAADEALYAAKRRGGGRLCTADADTLSEAVAGPRMGVQRNVDQRIDRAALDAMRMLDEDLADRPAVDRIRTVAGALSGALNAAAWIVGRWEPGEEAILTVSSADDRASRLRGEQVAIERREWPLPDHPALAELVAHGSGGYLARVDGEDATEATRAAMRELGFEAALVSAAEHAGDVWLLALVADGHSADLALAAARAQLLLRVAAAAPAAT